MHESSEVCSPSNKLKDLAEKYINPASNKPYTARTLRNWCEKGMGFKVVDNGVTDLQATLIDDYYREVTRGNADSETFRAVYANQLEQVKAQSIQGMGARQTEQVNIPQPQQYSAEQHEDAIYGALAVFGGDINDEIQQVNEVCEAVEDQAVEMIERRIMSVPYRVGQKLMQRSIQRREAPKPRIGIVGAISEALALPGVEYRALPTYEPTVGGF